MNKKFKGHLNPVFSPSCIRIPKEGLIAVPQSNKGVPSLPVSTHACFVF